MSDHEVQQNIVIRKRKFEEDSDGPVSGNETKRKFRSKDVQLRRIGLLELADEVLLEILKHLDGESLINLAKWVDLMSDSSFVVSKKKLLVFFLFHNIELNFFLFATPLPLQLLWSLQIPHRGEASVDIDELHIKGAECIWDYQSTALSHTENKTTGNTWKLHKRHDRDETDTE